MDNNGKTIANVSLPPKLQTNGVQNYVIRNMQKALYEVLISDSQKRVKK